VKISQIVSAVFLSLVVSAVIFVIGIILATAYIVSVDTAFYISVFSGIGTFIFSISLLVKDMQEDKNR